MKIERTKNASRNIVFGILLKLYQLAVPFVMRTAMIYLLGVQYLGLNSLFTSVLQVLNLAELGVGSAMVYSMYRPIAEDDGKTICALMRLYRTYYRVIGFVVLAAGLALVPFIPKLIHGDVPPDINVYVLYLLNLAATVLSYWLFAYKNSVFQAHQRTDVTSRTMLATETVKYVLQFAVLAVFHNYYYYVIIMLLSQAAANIWIAVRAGRMYPQYVAEGKLPKEEVKKINRRIKDLFTSKIGAVVVNSADTIVISAFLGLTALAVYQNYFYLVTAAGGVMAIVFQSVTAGIGNSLIVETKTKNFRDLKTFSFITAWISGYASSCFLSLFQPFMRLWVGEKLLLPGGIATCFAVYFYIYEMNHLLNTYKDAAGIWREDRFRPLVTALANLSLNLVMVRFSGLYGIILSTVVSMFFIGMPWLLYNLFTVLFDRKYLTEYLKKMGVYLIVSAAASAVGAWLCSLVSLPDAGLIAVRFLICTAVSNGMFFVFYRRTEEFGESVRLAKKMCAKKSGRIVEK